MTPIPLPPGAIVVGVDGSEDSDRAVVWAADQAAAEDRPLVLLHSAPPVWPSFYPGAEYLMMSQESVAAFAAASRAVLDAGLDLARTTGGPDVQVSSVDLETDPRDALLAASEQAHVVVLGSRGRGHAASIILGSVSATVAGRAACPVVVVRPRSDVARVLGVVVGVRLWAVSLPAVELAFAFASQRAVPLLIVHHHLDTEEPRDMLRRAYELDGERRARLTEAVGDIEAKYPDVEVTLDLGPGGFRGALAGTAAAHDLLVIGRRHTGPGTGNDSGLAQAIGRWSTQSILENAAGTVMVVPEAV